MANEAIHITQVIFLVFATLGIKLIECCHQIYDDILLQKL